MGRHAKKKIAGGGTNRPSALGLTHMTAATVVTPTTARVTYSSTVPVNAMIAPGYQTQPSLTTSTTAIQLTPNVLEIDFGDDIQAEGSIEWAGGVPGVLSPDSIAFT